MRLTPERLFLWVVVGAYVALVAAFAPRAPLPFFRPWERMLEGATDDRFVKNSAVTLPTCGDLSYNLCDPGRQVWRTTTFTTDVVGLRNAPLRAPPRVVIVGDSFVVGANLDDSETINVALARRLGETVYNHGSEFPGSELHRFFTDPRFRGAPPRTLVIMQACRNLIPTPAPEATWSLPAQPRVLALETALRDAVDHTKRDSTLSGWARQLMGSVRGRVSVHPYREVRWGDTTALCLSPSEQHRLAVGAAEKAAHLAASLLRWRDDLAARGTTLVFVPVPESMAVYPELFDPSEAGEGEPLLEACVAAVRQAGVTTIDLLPVFRANRTPYLYTVDDSHWSPRAVELAAEAIGSEVRPLLAR